MPCSIITANKYTPLDFPGPNRVGLILLHDLLSLPHDTCTGSCSPVFFFLPDLAPFTMKSCKVKVLWQVSELLCLYSCTGLLCATGFPKSPSATAFLFTVSAFFTFHPSSVPKFETSVISRDFIPALISAWSCWFEGNNAMRLFPLFFLFCSVLLTLLGVGKLLSCKILQHQETR